MTRNYKSLLLTQFGYPCHQSWWCHSRLLLHLEEHHRTSQVQHCNTQNKNTYYESKMLLNMQSKAVPLHITEELGGRESAAPTWPWPQNQMRDEWSALHPRWAPPLGKGPLVPTKQETEWVPRASLDAEARRKIICTARDWIPVIWFINTILTKLPQLCSWTRVPAKAEYTVTL